MQERVNGKDQLVAKQREEARAPAKHLRLLQDDNMETAPHSAGETERLPRQGDAPSPQSHVMVYHRDVYLAKTGEQQPASLAGTKEFRAF